MLRARAIADLADTLDAELEKQAGTALLADVELPLIDVIAGMERDGIAVDRPYLEELEERFATGVREAATAAYEVIGKEINLGSPKQLQVVLFDELQMPKTKRTKTGYTTDADSLQALFEKTEHPFLAYLLAHRDATRLRQTVEGLLKTISPKDARIHTTFNQTIAATGRLSSTDPNLQNIPIRTEEGRRIRQAFIVGEGNECADVGGLQPDRDADHGARVRGRGADLGVQLGHGLPLGDGVAGLLGRAVRGDAGDAGQDQGDELRARVRPVGVRAEPAAEDRRGRGARADGRVLRAVRRRPGLPAVDRRSTPARAGTPRRSWAVGGTCRTSPATTGSAARWPSGWR